jgi:OOP family OmpA-OmpF porin
MTRLYFCYSIFLFSFLGLHAQVQNLIPNSSFEVDVQKPKTKIGEENSHYAAEWEYPTKAKPDYYVSGKKGKFCDEFVDNLLKYKEPHSGKAYVGIMGYGIPEYALHQYLQVKLKQKLTKDQLYCLSFYISLRTYWPFSTNEIDYCLTSNKIEQKSNGRGRLKVTDYKKFIAKSGYFEPNGWNFVSSCYTALGNEEYLTIGMINPDYKVFSLYEDKTALNKEMYLFIDDVSLVPVSSTDCKCDEIKFTKSVLNDYSLAINKPLVIKNINFESGKAKLLPVSNEELNKLTVYLKTNSNYKIELSGHTDNTGDEIINQTLSQERAKTIANYLINSCIDKKRITHKGEGSKKPLKPNDTEENRLLNRRVEIKLIK